MSDESLSCFNRGVMARRNGDQKSDNPYVVASEQFFEWYKGWSQQDRANRAMGKNDGPNHFTGGLALALVDYAKSAGRYDLYAIMDCLLAVNSDKSEADEAVKTIAEILKGGAK